MKYFTEEEFKRCTPSCSMSDMDDKLLEVLDNVRELAGIPIVLNCAYRSKSWDIKKGRSGNSSHTRGLAVDIRCTTSTNRYKILNALMELGIPRIGIDDNFIHFDIDDSLPQGVVWHY